MIKLGNKKELLTRQANLPILLEPIERHLQILENQLEERLKEVNQRISGNENESFHQSDRKLPLVAQISNSN